MTCIEMMSIKNGRVKASVKSNNTVTEIEIDFDKNCTRVDRDNQIKDIASRMIAAVSDD